MLVAYEHDGLQIKEIPEDDVKVFLHPIASRTETVRILAEAARQRPDVRWVIVGVGPWGVRGEILQ
jgi:hypothetical protein